MPTAYQIDAANGVVELAIEGSASTDEIIEMLTEVLHSPGFRSGLRTLVDLRSSELDVHTADVQRVAEFLIRHRDAIVPMRAAVVVSKPVTFGLMRMFQVYGAESSIVIEIFHDIDVAREWLESPAGAKSG